MPSSSATAAAINGAMKPSEVPAPPEDPQHGGDVDQTAQEAPMRVRPQQPRARHAGTQVGYPFDVERIGDRHGRERVNAPRHHPPVKRAVGRRPADRLGRARNDAEGRVVVIVDPFDRPPRDEGGPGASAKQHAGPRERREVGLLILGAQTYRAEASERHPAQETDDADSEPLIHEAEVARQDVVQARDKGAGLLRRQAQREAGNDNDQQDDREHHAVDLRR